MSGPTLTARTTSIALYQGDDLDKIESLRMDLARAKASASGPARIGDTDDSVRAAEAALAAACDDAEPRAVVVVVKPLPRRQWGALIGAHPARDDNTDDAYFGFNVATLPDALLATGPSPDQPRWRRSIVAPEFETQVDLETFLDDLTDADFTRVWRSAVVLNKVTADDPKDLLAFEQIRASDETLN